MSQNTLVAVAALLAGCACSTPPPESSEPPGGAGAAPREVEVVSPVRRTLRREVRVAYSVEAFEQATLFAKAAGYLKRIHVDEGDRVRKGQVLAELEMPEAESEMEELRARDYGQANARIIHARDHDSRDVRTREYGRFIQQEIQKLAAEARTIIEEKEERQLGGIKLLIRRCHRSRSKRDKKELDGAKTLYPRLFSRAWSELKRERPRSTGAPPRVLAAEPEPETPPMDVLYPLDPEARQGVMEIERVVIGLGQDLRKLKALGSVDDILLQTCRRLVARAKDSLTGRLPSKMAAKRLEMTRKHLLITWRQVESRLRALQTP